MNERDNYSILFKQKVLNYADIHRNKAAKRKFNVKATKSIRNCKK